MTTGASGTYAFNGVDIPLQPTTGRWVGRDSYGEDGAGHPIYPAVRDFELIWQLTSVEDLQTVNNAYDSVSNTGTIVVDLPKYGDSQYNFYSYSGCTLHEPEYDTYFERHVQNVRLLITNVRTN